MFLMQHRQEYKLGILLDFLNLNIHIVIYFLLVLLIQVDLAQEYYQVLNISIVVQMYNLTNNHHTTRVPPDWDLQPRKWNTELLQLSAAVLQQI